MQKIRKIRILDLWLDLSSVHTDIVNRCLQRTNVDVSVRSPLKTSV